MKEQQVAKAYARSILELGEDKGTKIVDEMVRLTETINASGALENVLFMDVFTIDEKKAVFGDIAAKIGLSPLLQHAVFFLIEEKRAGLLPLIIKEAVVLDDDRRGFLRGVVEGAEAHADPKVVEQIKAFLKKRLGREPQLSYSQNANISAGYRVTVDDLQLDASLDNQLEQFKKSVISE